MTDSEASIQADILQKLGGRSDLRLWRSATGVARALHDAQVVRFGIPGQPDLSGILHDGRYLGIEVKTAKGRQSEAQRNFEAMVTKFRGIYLVARSYQDALSKLRNKGYCLEGDRL